MTNGTESVCEFDAVAWSGVEPSFVNAMLRSAPSGFRCWLFRERENPADSDAVVIAVSSNTVENCFSLDRVSTPDAVVFWRIGYIRRRDTGRPALLAALDTAADGRLDGTMRLDSGELRVYVESLDDDRSDIPF